MDVPALLTPRSENFTSSNAELLASEEASVRQEGFSNHLKTNVEKLENNRPESSTEVKKIAESPRNTKSEHDTKESFGSDALAVKEGDVPEASAGLPQGSEEMVGAETFQQAPGLSIAASAIEDKRSLEKMTTSGKGLPPAAGMGALLNNEQLDNLTEPVKDIVFDPLSDVEEAPLKRTTLTANHFASDKVRFDGKNDKADFFKSSSPLGSLEPANKSDVLDIALERLQKQSPVASSTTKPVIERPVVQASSDLDVSGLNLTTSTPGSELKAPLLTDKPVIQLNTPVNNTSWGDSFNQRIHWLVNQSVSGAQIRLNPQHMGPVEVRIQIQNDQATVSFTAQHAATKEAIDAALPRLREMLSEQNVNVVEMDVSQHSFAEQREQQTLAEHENKAAQAAESDKEMEGSVFEHQDDSQQRAYSGLFSDFA